MKETLGEEEAGDDKKGQLGLWEVWVDELSDSGKGSFYKLIDAVVRVMDNNRDFGDVFLTRKVKASCGLGTKLIGITNISTLSKGRVACYQAGRKLSNYYLFLTKAVAEYEKKKDTCVVCRL